MWIRIHNTDALPTLLASSSTLPVALIRPGLNPQDLHEFFQLQHQVLSRLLPQQRKSQCVAKTKFHGNWWRLQKTHFQVRKSNDSPLSGSGKIGRIRIRKIAIKNQKSVPHKDISRFPDSDLALIHISKSNKFQSYRPGRHKCAHNDGACPKVLLMRTKLYLTAV